MVSLTDISASTVLVATLLSKRGLCGNVEKLAACDVALHMLQALEHTLLLCYQVML